MNKQDLAAGDRVVCIDNGQQRVGTIGGRPGKFDVTLDGEQYPARLRFYRNANQYKGTYGHTNGKYSSGIVVLRLAD